MRKIIDSTLQIGYWLMYFALLSLFFLLVSAQKSTSITLLNYASWTILMLLTAVVPGVISFYAAYLYAFKEFLQAKKFKGLLATALIVSFVAALVSMVLVSVTISTAFWTADGSAGVLLVLFILSSIAFVNFTMGLIVKGFVTWYNDLQVKEELNRRNYEMELSLIKAQINPHFLFNTINNIDVLIMSDNTKASAYLNKLSDIMRFMLYETKTSKIPLSKELAYITKYVDLQKIRTSRPNNIQLTVNEHVNGWTVEPMLFIPFIENAFKHYTSGECGFVKINISTLSNSIQFDCSNSFEENGIKTDSFNGLGSGLIEKRLSLLYQNKHELLVTSDNYVYKVRLTIFR
jgi:two-component system, LytTR family, sensor kinase